MNIDDIKKLNNDELLNYKKTLEQSIKQKNNLQLMYKIPRLNGFYGALSNRFFRYFDNDIRSSITLGGQLAIRYITKYIENKISVLECIYNDTDSCYFHFPKIIEKIKNKYPDKTDKELIPIIDNFIKKYVNPIIKEGYEKLTKIINSNENRMFMDREVIARSIIWTAKKKYVMLVMDSEGVTYNEPKMKVKGIEVIQSSTPICIQKSLKKGLKILLINPNEISNFIKEEYEKFLQKEPEDIACPRGVNNIEKYVTPNLHYIKGCPINVRAAIVHNKYIKDKNLEKLFNPIFSGDKEKMLYLKLPNIVHENIIGFKDDMLPNKNILKQYIDYDTQFDKTFTSVLEKIGEKISIYIDKSNRFDMTKVEW